MIIKNLFILFFFFFKLNILLAENQVLIKKEKMSVASDEIRSSQDDESFDGGILTGNCILRTDKKKSRLFYVIIRNVDGNEYSKQFIFDNIESICDQIMVCDTAFNESLEYEQRIYVRLKKIAPVEQFCKKIKSTYDENFPQDIFVETPNHSRVIRKCCQYDVNPIYKELNEDEFSIQFQLHKWVLNTKKFSLMDPFLRAHKISLDYAKRYHENYYRSLKTLKPLKRINQIKKFNAWQDDVIEWFNDFIDESNTGPKKQLYLYGKSNTGKTYFILHYLFAQYLNQIFIPCASEGKFAYSHWDPQLYNILIADEFDIEVRKN